MYIESKENETVIVPIFAYKQTIHINKVFSVTFPVGTSLKIQLTTDMEPGFSKPQRWNICQVTRTQLIQNLQNFLFDNRSSLNDVCSHTHHLVWRTQFRTWYAEYSFELVNSNDQETTQSLLSEIQKIWLMKKERDQPKNLRRRT